MVVFYLPKNVTKIGYRAFGNCTLLERIWIDESVTSIDETAFYYSDKVVIHGVAGSYAETFATENEIEFSTERIIQNYDKNTVTGKVVDANGNGIADVFVKIYNTTLNKLEFEIFTDEAGEWKIENRIYETEYEIRYYKTLYEFSSEKINCVVGSGTTIVADVVGNKVELQGYECNEEDYTYIVSDGYATITGYTGTATNILIPDGTDNTIRGS